jgi:hypothetical protein
MRAGESVANPELYNWYSADEATSFFGSPNDGRHLCNGQWVIFPKTAICLTEIGPTSKHKPKYKSYFGNGAQFCWLADQPYEVSDSPLAHFVPAEVTAPRGKEYSIRLFVRPPQAQKYLYAGELAPSYVLQFSLHENRGIATFKLEPTLPSSVWVKLGGLRLGDLDVAALDQALGRLRRPTTVHDRLAILQQLIEFWHGPIQPEDGMTDADMTSQPLPLPLRWWYRFAGKRAEIMSGQNILFVPRDFQNKYRMLRVMNGRLFFYTENQGVYQWSTLLQGDDPPVFGRYGGRGRWAKESVALSEHLILMCLFEAVLCHANYGASAACLDEDQLAAVVAKIPPIAIRPWRWDRVRFFVGQGVFVRVADNPADDKKRWYSVSIGAKTEQPLQFLKPLMNERWERVAL